MEEKFDFVFFHRPLVSDIYRIDEIGKAGATKSSFYIQTQVDPSYAVYICYLSQLDEHYIPSNQSLQIRAGFTV
jgi:hypothetical protein